MTDATVPTPGPSSSSEPPRWYRHRRRGYLWPMLLIAVGVFFLLGNLGYLPPLSWRAVGSLWPVLLVLLGIEMVVGGPQPLVALAIEALVVVAAVALVAAQPYGLLAPVTGTGTPGSSFSRPLEGAHSLALQVEGGGGTYTVAGGAAGLVDASSQGGEIAVHDSRRGDHADVRVQLADPGGPFRWGGAPPSAVSVRVASGVPTSLRVSGGAGDFAVDLRDITVTDARVDTGASRLDLTLPTPSGDVPVRVSAGAASVTIVVPDGVEASVTTSGGILSTTTLNPRLGSGTSSGVARSGTTEQTPGYATAPDRVTVTISAGASSVTIR